MTLPPSPDRMRSPIAWRHSLKTRATAITLAVFVVGLWALSLYAIRLLQADIQRLLGQQQLSTARLLSHEVNDRLTVRLQALEAIAREITPDMLAQPEGLQALLEQRPLLSILFNGGAWAAAADGVALAEVPRSAQRVGTAYGHVDFVAEVLRTGHTVISRPVIGQKRQRPVVAILVAIRDAQGRVAGVISGVTDLDKPNFLDPINQASYGDTGGYALISARHRVVVYASDNRLTMQALPPAGTDPWVDRFVAGHEGFAVFTDTRGVEVLASIQRIPVADWYVQVTLPTAEAFAPVRDTQHRIRVAAALLTLLTGALTWWALKRQLAPLADTAQAMELLARDHVAPPMATQRPDEIGQLVASFNELRDRHLEREHSLRESEQFKDAVLDSLSAEVAVVDHSGTLLAVNERWRQVALDNGPEPGIPAANTGVGSNYFAVCRQAAAECQQGAREACTGLQAVLEGRLPSFHLDYACDTPQRQRWFNLTIMPLGRGVASGAVLTHTDITERRKAQERLAQVNQRMSALISAIPDPLFFKDGEGRWLIVNEPAKRLYELNTLAWEGRTSAELSVLQPPFQTAHRECADSDEQTWRLGSLCHFTETVVSPDGTAHHFDVRKIPMFDDTGARQSMVIIGRDISELKSAEESLRIAATAFEAQQGMVITDAHHTILRVNRAFTQITGYSAEEVRGQRPSLLASGRHDPAFYAVMAQALANAGTWSGEIWNRRKNGEIYPEWLSISAVRDADGQTSHFVGIFSDISEQVRAQAQINSLAFYDPLTHLPNRRLLLDRLAQSLKTSTRSRHRNALLFVDLDNFKTINDIHGHHLGDALLVQVAQRLQHSIRDGDTLARLGSDEFVVLLERLGDDDLEAATQAEAVGHGILAAFQDDFALAFGPHHNTLSIGITLYGGGDDSAEQPIKRAELAMFQAKAAGRNLLRFFDPRMQAEVAAHAALEADLRQALQQQQFSLHYQAQVVGAGRITGAEVLLRWQHPQRGSVPPAQFIPLAEESGLILPIGQWVLDTACAQLATWEQQPDLAHLTLAVNVSALQFRQAGFVNQVLDSLARARANPRRLKLELTESMLVDNVEAVIANMETLKAKGIAFSLDDFGTGYSSLAYLKRLPLNQLKIDQGFVRNIVTDPNDAAIAKMVVVLADSLGLSVIAEGVELQAQADFLAHQGCHAYQGYLFSKPLPLPDFEALVRRG